MTTPAATRGAIRRRREVDGAGMSGSAHAHDGLVAWALHDGALVYIDRVARGLDCGCTCVRCGDSLIAKKGRKRRHHFAHTGESDCDGGVETILHKLAKELVAQLPSIALPEYRFQCAYSYRGYRITPPARVIVPARRVPIDRVCIEEPIGPIIPDLIIEREGHRLLVEIEVTHPVDRAKQRAARKLDVAMLAVQLGPSDAALSRDQLRVKLDTDLACKRWVFNPKQRAAEREWFRQRHEHRNHALAKRDAEDAAFRASVAPKVPRRPSGAHGSEEGTGQWRDFDGWAERVNARTGRYPTVEELRDRAAGANSAAGPTRRQR